MHPVWARSVRDQCVTAEVAFLFKQWGDWRYAVEVDDYEAQQALAASGQPDPFARTSCYTVGLDGSYSNTEPPRTGDATMMRVGKRRAGRALDGRTCRAISTRQRLGRPSPTARTAALRRLASAASAESSNLV